MTEKYYNIHNIISFKIVDETKFFRKSFSNVFTQYENFESNKIDQPDFTIYLRNFKPSNEDCYFLDDKYFIKNDYLYCKEDSYKFAKWEFEIIDLEKSGTVVNISNNFIGSMFIAGVIIDFVIFFKMNSKGYPMVHASSISKDNNAHIFSARSGGGKTTIALNLLEKGFNFLGDNFVIIHNSNALSYLSPLNIFTYNLAPIVKDKFRLKKKIIFGIKNIIYLISFGYAKIFTKINPKDIFPEKITNKSKLSSIFIIFPKEKFKFESICKDELIDYFVFNQKLDFPYFIKYISEYTFVFPESVIANFWEDYKCNLYNNLTSDLQYYKVEVPKKYDNQILCKILELLENGK